MKIVIEMEIRDSHRRVKGTIEIERKVMVMVVIGIMIVILEVNKGGRDRQLSIELRSDFNI